VALRVRRKRRQKLTKHRVFTPKWRDPYPNIAGTKPEKMIFAALIARGIYFIYQDSLPEWRSGQFSTLSVPQFVPDFVLPQYKVIIDPFSDYHHTLPDAVERDAEKMAIYTSMGYAFYHPWSTQVEASGGHAILMGIKELSGGPIHPMPAFELPYVQQGYRLGPYVGLGSTSVAAANRKRRKPGTRTVRRR
jgi:hypothetical protein